MEDSSICLERGERPELLQTVAVPRQSTAILSYKYCIHIILFVLLIFYLIICPLTPLIDLGFWGFGATASGITPSGPRTKAKPEKWTARSVPFPVESALSGVMKQVGPDKRLWYRRTFTVPAKWAGKNTLLHFGACDWEDDRLGQRQGDSASTEGGYDPFTFRRDRRPEERRRAGTRRLGLGPVRRRPAAAGQAGPPAEQHLVHADDRHLADRVAGAGAADVHPSHHRRRRTSTPIPSPSARTSSGRLRRRSSRLCWRKPIGPGDSWGVQAGPPWGGSLDDPFCSLPEAAKAKPWTPDTPNLFPLKARRLGDGSSRSGRELLRHAQDQLGKDDKGVTRLMLNDKPFFQIRPARPGLLARRPLHRPDRRGPQVRHRDDQEARLQHDPQARQGRAGALVLLVRQARPARLAGHAQRRPRASAPGQAARSSARRNRPSSYERELKAMIDARRQPPVHRHVGAVQRGLGPVRHRPRRRVDQEVRPDAAGRLRQRLERLAAGDVHDMHVYPGPGSPKPEDEAGGRARRVRRPRPAARAATPGKNKNWGYRRHVQVTARR